MHHAVSDEALDQLFRAARSHNKWFDTTVSETMLRAVYDLLRWGPTSANCSPGRFVFVATQKGKERLKPYLSPGNVNKVMTAPVTVIIGYDLKFYDKLPQLFPHTNARSWYVGNEELIKTTAFRNSTLQGGYLLIAARSLGLDAGPMSGFDNAGVDKEFFANSEVKSNFICALGDGDPSGVFGRSPRLSFEEACQIV